MRKFYTALLILVLSLSALALTACRGDDGPGDWIPDLPDDILISQGVDFGWTGVDMQMEAEITLGFWGLGPTGLFRDIGNVAHDPVDMSRNGAAAMAVARIFNQAFPNAVINVQNNGVGDPAGRNNFYIEHGMHVDAFMTSNLVNDIVGGHIADLTLFSDDPVLNYINPTVLRMMSHHDRLWAIPTLLMPIGLFVNRTLAENQNLDMPSEDWTMNEFIDFVSNSRADEFYGILGIPWPLMDTMTPDIHHQLLFREQGEPFVRMDTPAVREVLRMAPRIMHHSFHTNNHAGNISQAFHDQFGGIWNQFAQGAMLVFYAEPWRMAYAGSPVAAGRVQVPDWDYFPRPSTEWVENHVGTLIDPFPIRNFAMDDGDPILNWDQYNMLRLTWELVRFYALDLRSWQARSDMLWGPQQMSSKLESFPFTVGRLYYDMMDVYFQAEERQIFADARQFPGFHYIMQLWEQGNMWGLSGNAFPFTMNWEGGTRAIMHEWNIRWSADAVGVHETDPSWYDQVLAHLPGWDREFNDRFQERFDDIQEAMVRFYFPQRRLSQ